MNFGAADFKMCPDTEELLFLEFSAPMFAAFKKHSEISIVDNIIGYLSEHEEKAYMIG